MNLLAAALLAVPPLTGAAAYFIRSARLRTVVSLLGSAATLALVLVTALRVFSGGALMAWGGAFRVDALSGFMLLLTGLLTFAAAVFSPAYLAGEMHHGLMREADSNRYYFWFHLFTGAMLWAETANNLGVMWAAVEATTLASAFLVGFYGKPRSLEAAWKYVLICSTGLAIALLGTSVTYAAAMNAAGGLPASLNWSDLMQVAPQLSPNLMRLAFVFVLVGYGTKAGFAPLHTWLPDAHSQAPSPVSAILSGALLSSSFYAILRFYVLTNGALGAGFAANLLIGFGLVSMAVAVPFIALQTDLKRLLAYSSVEHMGVAAIGIGIGGPLGVFGAVYHLFFHGIAKALLFFIAGAAIQRYKSRRIHRIRGLVKASPFLGAALLAGVLAITGTPPFALFLSEWNIAAAAFHAGQTGVGIAFLALLATIFGAFLYHTGPVVLGLPGGYAGRRTGGEATAATPLAAAATLAEAALAAAEAAATTEGTPKRSTLPNRPTLPLAQRVVILAGFALLLLGGLFVPTPVSDVVHQVSVVLGVF